VFINHNLTAMGQISEMASDVYTLSLGECRESVRRLTRCCLVDIDYRLR